MGRPGFDPDSEKRRVGSLELAEVRMRFRCSGGVIFWGGFWLLLWEVRGVEVELGCWKVIDSWVDGWVVVLFGLD